MMNLFTAISPGCRANDCMISTSSSNCLPANKYVSDIVDTSAVEIYNDISYTYY